MEQRTMFSVVVIGGRGYTGSELLPLLWHHPKYELVTVGSRSVEGQTVASVVPGLDGCTSKFSKLTPENIHQIKADAYILALPNGESHSWAEAIDAAFADALIVDLSADHRFDDHWVYGQPEWFGARVSQSRRIANPGCYATAMMLALMPVADDLENVPVAFGLSGYSGAGRTPSRRNDPEVLKDNILPYQLVDHIHEREVSGHLGHRVRFLPHVASFFRGISMSVSASLTTDSDAEMLLKKYTTSYGESPLVDVIEQVPEVRQVVGSHMALIGGFSVSKQSPRELSLVCVLDNLLKGAATQAVQNLNLVFGLEMNMGIKK